MKENAYDKTVILLMDEVKLKEKKKQVCLPIFQMIPDVVSGLCILCEDLKR